MTFFLLVNNQSYLIYHKLVYPIKSKQWQYTYPTTVTKHLYEQWNTNSPTPLASFQLVVLYKNQSNDKVVSKKPKRMLFWPIGNVVQIKIIVTPGICVSSHSSKARGCWLYFIEIVFNCCVLESDNKTQDMELVWLFFFLRKTFIGTVQAEDFTLQMLPSCLISIPQATVLKKKSSACYNMGKTGRSAGFSTLSDFEMPCDHVMRQKKACIIEEKYLCHKDSLGFWWFFNETWDKGKNVVFNWISTFACLFILNKMKRVLSSWQYLHGLLTSEKWVKALRKVRLKREPSRSRWSRIDQFGLNKSTCLLVKQCNAPVL